MKEDFLQKKFSSKVTLLKEVAGIILMDTCIYQGRVDFSAMLFSLLSSWELVGEYPHV